MSQNLRIAGSKAHRASILRRVIFGPATLVACAVLLLPLAWGAFARNNPLPFLAGAGTMLFGLHILWRFIRDCLEDERGAYDELDLASALSPCIVRALRGKADITATDLLLAAISTPQGIYLLEEMGITSQSVTALAEKHFEERVDIEQFLKDAIVMLPPLHERRVSANVILTLFFRHVPECEELLNHADLSPRDLQGILAMESLHRRMRQEHGGWSPQAIRSLGSVGRSWVMGYTSALDRLTTDISEHASDAGERNIVIHEREIDAVLHVLARESGRNVLLVGRAGTGKRRLVENVAFALRKSERVLHQEYTRVLTLHVEQLLSGAGSTDGYFLKALEAALKAGKFILTIHSFGLVLQAASPQLKAVLLRCLEAKHISLIGIVDPKEYHQIVKADPTLDGMIEKVIVPDATDEETLDVLMAHACALERRHMRTTYAALKATVDLSKRYVGGNVAFPRKALEILSDAFLLAKELKLRSVTEDHIREVISRKGKMNIQSMSVTERERLLSLGERLEKRIIGQKRAISSVVSALKRARVDLHERRKPIGTFLFVGPTGVGKTETAKALAEEYFGDVSSFIRLDMNEYAHADSIFGIIGSADPSASAKEGFLAQRVQERPFSLVLLDEVEKAHPTVLNLFLQILDEGMLTDAQGTRTNFRNTVIIATSNAGALALAQELHARESQDEQEVRKAVMDILLHQGKFSPEFLNRFDDVVVFHPLAAEDARLIASIMLQELKNSLYERKGITVQFGEGVEDILVERGYSVEFGARQMRRVITDLIEDFLANELLKRDVKRGETMTIEAKDLR